MEVLKYLVQCGVYPEADKHGRTNLMQASRYSQCFFIYLFNYSSMCHLGHKTVRKYHILRCLTKKGISKAVIGYLLCWENLYKVMNRVLQKNFKYNLSQPIQLVSN